MCSLLSTPFALSKFGERVFSTSKICTGTHVWMRTIKRLIIIIIKFCKSAKAILHLNFEFYSEIVDENISPCDTITSDEKIIISLRAHLNSQIVFFSCCHFYVFSYVLCKTEWSYLKVPISPRRRQMKIMKWKSKYDRMHR